MGAVGSRTRAVWLLLAAVLVLILSLQSTAHAGGAFTLVPDATPPSLPPGSELVGVADLTSDGIPDLIVENTQADTLGVMLGNGTGGFGPASSIPLGARPVGVHVADFNDDGHPDLLVAIETKSKPRELNPLPEGVEILSGDGNGNFIVGPQVVLPERGPVYVGDFTANGNADVVVAPDGCFGEPNNSKFHMLLGDGHGDLSAGPTTTAETTGCGFEVGDFTGDGRDDLVTYGQGNEDISVLPSEPAGGFGPAITTPAPPDSWFIARGPADLDGNGTPDLVLARFTEPSSFDVMSGNGAGGFTASGPYASGSPYLSSTPVFGDFSGDGHIDIASFSGFSSPRITVLENNGAGAFSTGLVVPLTGTYYEAFAADVNADGRPDVILSGPSGVEILLDEPATSMPPASEPPRVQAPHRGALAVAATLKLARRAHKGRRTLQINGRLRLERGLAVSRRVCGGKVLLVVRFHGKTVTRRGAALTGTCTFRATVAVAVRQLAHKGKLTLTISFGGNTYLLSGSVRKRI